MSGAVVIARREDLQAADTKKDPRHARGKVLESIAKSVREVVGAEVAPAFPLPALGQDDDPEGLCRTLGAVALNGPLSEEQASAVRAKGMRVWSTPVRSGALVPYDNPMKVHRYEWPLDLVRRNRIGVPPKGLPIGFIDSTMPVTRRPFRGVSDYRRFPDGVTFDSIWHSCATTLLVTDKRLGMAPKARLILAAVLTELDGDTAKGDPASVVEGLRWLLHWRGGGGETIELINASIDVEPDGSAAIQALLDNAAGLGRRPVVVASAGNSATPERPEIAGPAELPGVVAVGALDPAGAVWPYSGWRPASEGTPRKPDLVAPGRSIYTIDAQGSMTACSGTSLAAPYVTGALARLMATGLGAQDALKVLMEQHVMPMDDPRAGAGALCGNRGE